MGTKIFVNLPVKDLTKTERFFTKLGYNFAPEYSDKNAKCMIINDDIYVMLLVEPFFKTFTKKEIADTRKTSEAILSLSADSRQQVDELLRKTIAAGGVEIKQSQQEQAGMYGRSFQDPDGHIWEVFYMDPKQIRRQPQA